MIRAQEDALLEDEVYTDEETIQPASGFFDDLSQQFGNTPWWIISGAFHGLIVLLAFLIGMAVMQAKQKETIVTVTIQDPIKPIIDPPPVPKKVLENPQIVTTEMPVIEDLVVVHDPVIEDHIETEDIMETQTAQGDPNMLSDLSLPNQGFFPTIGVGGGGGGQYGRRDGRGKRRALRDGGGGPKTETAVDAALRWLANHQEPDGRWDTQKYEAGAKTDTACTGLVLLAFLGAGHTEKVGKFKDNVKRAVAWLKSVQAADGCYYAPGDGGTSGPGYAHAIAGMAMAEAAGMARKKETITSAQKGMDYSTKVHAAKAGNGGNGGAYEGGGPWRYRPGQAGDTSVTGWFVMQLKSGKVSGLNVPAGAFDAAIAYLDKVEKRKGDDAYGASTYWYTPSREFGHQGHHHRLSSIGNLCRQFLGWDKNALQSSVEKFVNDGGVPNWEKCDLYYWYYGTLCVFQQRGDLWKRWNEAMKQTLLTNQRKGGDEDGSWDPVGSFSEKWGRVGQTALACLCLEVYYRYLPMYQ